MELCCNSSSLSCFAFYYYTENILWTNQTACISYTSELDQLPGGSLKSLNSEIDEDLVYNLLKQATSELASLIREAGVNRSRQLSAAKHANTVCSYYWCVDMFWDKNFGITSQRDGCQMDTFPCNTRFQFKVDLYYRRIIVSLRHEYHASYVDHHLSEKCLEFVRDCYRPRLA